MSTDNVYSLYSTFWKITKISFCFLLTANTKKFVASCCLYFLVYGYIFYKALNDSNVFSSGTQKPITAFLDATIILINTGIAISAIIFLYKHEARVDNLQFLINDYDVCLKEYASTTFTTKNKSSKTIKALTINFVLTNIYYAGKTIFLCIYFGKVKWILVLQVFYKYIITFTLTKQNIFTSFVYWRFFYLNVYIKSLYDLPVNRLSNMNDVCDGIDWKNEEYQLSVDTKSREVKRIRNAISLSKILHDHLRNIVDILTASTGRFYGQFIFIVILEQLQCILDIFTVLKLYYRQEETNSLAWFFSFSDLCFGYLSQFYLMLYVTNSLLVESFRTGNHIQKLFFYIKTSSQTEKHLIRDLRLFSLEVIHRKVKIAPDGIYEVSWNNILTVLGEILSYILFLIQYQLNMDRTL